MKVSSSFKHLDHTPALDEKIQDKSNKLKKYFDGNFEVQWTCFVREDGEHCAGIKVIGPQFDYHAEAHSDNLYKSFDLVVNKIERQIQKKKSKWKNRINKQNLKSPKYEQQAEGLKDEQYWQDKSEEDVA